MPGAPISICSAAVATVPSAAPESNPAVHDITAPLSDATSGHLEQLCCPDIVFGAAPLVPFILCWLPLPVSVF